MARVFGLLAATLLLGSVGCGTRVTAGPAIPPPAAGEPQTEATPQRVEAPPKLIAPPPAYGNKVVLAQAERASSRF